MRKTSPAWSFRGRSLHSMPKPVPGPGTYSPTLLDSIPCYRIGKSQRLTSESKFSIPGPGNYTPSKPVLNPPNTVFSRSKRPQLSIPPETPGPGAYDPKTSTFTPSYKIPESSLMIIDSAIPGPGTYCPQVANNEPVFSMPKARRDSLYEKQKEVPGPGSYNVDLDIGGTKFVIAKAQRYFDKKFASPGPGAYTVRSAMDMPKYSMSARRGSAAPEDKPGPGAYSPTMSFTSINYSIGKAKHLTIKAKDGPGPGSYSPSNRKGVGITVGNAKRQPLSQIIDTPGPGSYEFSRNEKSPSYSISKKNKAQKLDSDPGPGQYTPRSALSSAPSWRMGTESKRLQFKDQKVPGPGSYHQQTTNEKKSFSFSKCGVKPRPKNTGPGPGAYEIKPAIGELPSYSKS